MATLFGRKSFIVAASLISVVAFAAGCTQGNYPASCLQSNGGDCKTCTPGEKTSCFDGKSVADANKLETTLQGQQELGQCRAGTKVCLPDSTWSTCDGAVGPSAEVCGNQIDDDCNGLIDSKDTAACSCNPGETRKQFRDVDGKLVYDVPSGVSHVVYAKTANPKTRCTYCIQTCSNGNIENPAGKWVNADGACDPTGPTKDDVCNEIDDDCDGLIDEDIYQNGNSKAAKGDVCVVGTGACQNFGRLQCAPMNINSVVCNVSARDPSDNYSAKPFTNGSWDWNCNGEVEMSIPGDIVITSAGTAADACKTFNSTLPNCQTSSLVAFSVDSKCGGSVSLTKCMSSGSSCVAAPANPSKTTIQCK